MVGTRNHDIVDWLLLDYLDLYRSPLASLAGEHVDQLFNKPHHRLTVDALAERLERLLSEGFVSLEYRSRKYEPSLGRLRLILKKGRQPGEKVAFIGLTKAGGEVWEKVFQPDWGKFHILEADATLADYVLEAASESYAKELFSFYSKAYSPIDGSIRRCMLNPWRATYWKTLPDGYRISFTGEKKIGDKRNNSLLSRGLDRLSGFWRLKWRGLSLDEGLVKPGECF